MDEVDIGIGNASENLRNQQLRAAKPGSGYRSLLPYIYRVSKVNGYLVMSDNTTIAIDVPRRSERLWNAAVVNGYLPAYSSAQ